MAGMRCLCAPAASPRALYRAPARTTLRACAARTSHERGPAPQSAVCSNGERVADVPARGSVQATSHANEAHPGGQSVGSAVYRLDEAAGQAHDGPVICAERWLDGVRRSRGRVADGHRGRQAQAMLQSVLEVLEGVERLGLEQRPAGAAPA